MLQIQVGTYPR